MHVRLLNDSDYPALSDLYKAVYPEDTKSVDELHHRSLYRDPRCLSQQWVVEKDGMLVAIAGYDQDTQHYHPHIFVLDGMVHPAYQFRGIGSALFEHVLASLHTLTPLAVRLRVREDMSASIRFFEGKGFQKQRYIQVSYLKLATFYPDYFAVRNAQSLTIKMDSLKGMAWDVARDQKLYKLVNELSQDVPSSEPRYTLSYDEYVKYKLNAPSLFAEGYSIAYNKHEYVGISELKKTASSGALTTGLTSVKRSYRQRGIALALKLKSINCAKVSGYETIQTTNDTRNAAILSLNKSLGFVRQHVLIECVKTL